MTGPDGDAPTGHVAPHAGEPDRAEVVVRLGSGLGNQLFQLAAGHTVAAAIGGRCTYTQGPQRPSSPAVEHVIGTSLPRPSASTLSLVGLNPATRPRSLRGLREGVVRRLARRRGDVVVIRQSTLRRYDAFDPAAIGEAQIALLDGCFQHRSYFQPAIDHVGGLLRNALDAVGDDVAPHDATVVSFRRGDFLMHGWALDQAYYRSALDAVRTAVGASGVDPIVVVGDDPFFNELVVSWLRTQGHDVRLPERCGVDPVVHDLALLARADRVVMSNSTFCWWGVVAGSQGARPDKRVVVAPRAWLPGDGPDLGRDGWLAIDNGWDH